MGYKRKVNFIKGRNNQKNKGYETEQKDFRDGYGMLMMMCTSCDTAMAVLTGMADGMNDKILDDELVRANFLVFHILKRNGVFPIIVFFIKHM